jgi:hypothetical protein
MASTTQVRATVRSTMDSLPAEPEISGLCLRDVVRLDIPAVIEAERVLRP